MAPTFGSSVLVAPARRKAAPTILMYVIYTAVLRAALAGRWIACSHNKITIFRNALMLKLQQVTRSYSQEGGSTPVLIDINLEISKGETVALTGESGCGKSTLLHLIAGLDKPDSGSIEINEVNLKQLSDDQLADLRREKVSLVFQQFHLIPTLTVRDNMCFQAELCNRLDDAYEAHLVEKLGLGNQLGKFPWQLSRGQQQRVAIGRALLHRPAIVLADEPTGNLDEAASLEVMALFSELIDQTDATLLMVTHSRQMADFMGRILRLQNGRIETVAD
ncbi:MAG: putative ABC transport system ATP-binding protein [Gammaproteobacteria bacterium]|jgi:putative ABC transport system ATP-binding protein